MELLDDKYRLLRQHLPTRKTFFDDVRALTRYLLFESWDHLLTFMLEGLELEVPQLQLIFHNENCCDKTASVLDFALTVADSLYWLDDHYVQPFYSWAAPRLCEAAFSGLY